MKMKMEKQDPKLKNSCNVSIPTDYSKGDLGSFML